jgi:hypothetical protein
MSQTEVHRVASDTWYATATRVSLATDKANHQPPYLSVTTQVAFALHLYERHPNDRPLQTVLDGIRGQLREVPKHE